MAEEEEKIEPTITGMPIETLFRRHSQFLLVLAFCFFLGWYTFALFLIAWITGARWADNEGYLEKYYAKVLNRLQALSVGKNIQD